MATRSLGQLTIDLIAKTGGFEAGMDRAARKSKDVASEIDRHQSEAAKSIQQTWSTVGSFIGGALAGISVGAVFSKFIAETVAARNEQAQLAAVLKSTGNAAGFTVRQLNEMAASMEAATTFSGGDINQAQTALLAFAGVAGDQFPRALQAAADMAARTGMSIKAAAETIGRSLDVPSQGLASLSRQGFKFDGEQKKLAERLESTGRVAEAQAIVLGALEESYGGAAAAARDTLGGSLLALQNTVSSLLTGEGGGIEALRGSINGLNEALSDGRGTAALNATGTAAQVVAGVFVTRLVVATSASAIAFATATVQAGRYQLALASMAGVSATTAASLTALSVAGRVVGVVMGAILSPIGAVVTVLGAAAYAVYSYSESAESASGATSVLVDRAQLLAQSFESLTAAQARSKLLDVRLAMEQASSEAEDVEFRIRLLKQSLDEWPDSSMAKGWNEDLIRQEAALESVKNQVSGLAQQVVVLNGVISAPAGVRALSTEYEKLVANLDRQIALMGKSGQAAAIRYDLEHGELAKLSDEEKKLALQRVAALETAEKQVEAARKASSAASKQASELPNLIKRLDQQYATLGMTAEQSERYALETASGTAKQREQALATYDQIQAWKASEKAIQQAIDSGRQYLAFQRELEVFQQRMQLEVAGVGMSDRQREIAEQDLAIRQEYAQKRLDLEQAQQVESTALDQVQYQERLRLLQGSEQAKLRIVQDAAEARLLAEGDWLNGAKRAMQNYVEDVSKISTSVESLFTGMFGGMEDAMVRFSQTGRLSFRDLIDSMLADLVRLAVRQSITGPLASWIMGGVGGLFGGGAGGVSIVGGGLGGGGISPESWLPGLSSGGYTGDGGKFEPAGIVHRGEYVLNQEAVDRIGVDFLNRLNRGYSSGGLVGAEALPGFEPRDSSLQVVVENRGVDIDVVRSRENQMRIIAREEASVVAPKVVAQDMGRPNSRVWKSMSKGWKSEPRR